MAADDQSKKRVPPEREIPQPQPKPAPPKPDVIKEDKQAPPPKRVEPDGPWPRK
jgi:hypothetical protein